MTTKIEWTRNADGSAGSTWNPIRGCSRISPGCGGGGSYSGTNGEQGGCYAEAIAARFSRPGQPFHRFAEMTPQGPRWTRKVMLLPELLSVPLRRSKPTTWFISMSDLFHEELTTEEIGAVYGVMAAARWHTFQVLTKRADRMEGFLSDVDIVRRVCEHANAEIRRAAPDPDGRGWRQWHSKFDASQTAWIYAGGCAAVAFSTREPDRAFPSWVRWPLPNVHIGVSVEDQKRKDRIDHLRRVPAAVRFLSLEPLLEDLGELDLAGIDQVIVGAESGHGARPMHDDWVRRIRDQAKAQGCAFFLKQMLDARGHKISLPMLDGRQWAEMPTIAGTRNHLADSNP